MNYLVGLIVLVLVALCLLLLLGGGALWAIRAARALARDAQPPGALMTDDAEQVNVRSADNVRLLSDDQLRALEEYTDED